MSPATLEAPPTSGLGRLAVLAPRWVGDLVMATPVFEAARSALGAGQTTILVRAHLAPLLAGSPVEADVRVLSGRGAETAALAELAPDAVLLLTNSLGAAWRAWRAGVPVRAGSSLHARRLLLTHVLSAPSCDGRRVPVPTAELLRDVAGLLDIEVADLHPRLAVTPAERARCAELLERHGIDPAAERVVCTPGAAFGAAKLWPPARFARALDSLCEARGWRAVVSGGPGERALVEAVARASTTGAVSLADETVDLGALKALIAGARLLLVGDSGPRWIAAAFDVPCVSIMGPNVPELTATSLERCEIVRVEGLECSPCARRRCPLGHHRCMLDIPAERVVAAAEAVLARSSQAD